MYNSKGGMENLIKLLIVDDDALIRDGLKVLFEIENDFVITGVASNGQEAFNNCKQHKPDIVLMDIRMPVMDGVLCTKFIKENFNDIKVIILTTFKDDEYIREAIKSGAEGYILKSQSSDSIIECVRTVMSGNTVLEKDIALTLSKMINPNLQKKITLPNLSSREFDILKLIGHGLSNKEISEILFLSEGTVRNYITILLEKFELRDRTQLAIFYVKNYPDE